MVGALTASSMGSCSASMSPRSITTEVSMSPCDGRGALATRRDLLAGGPIEICPAPVEPHPRSAPERGDGHLGADESTPTQRGKLADRNSVPGHDERLALVKLAHDVAAVIAQLALGDLPGHPQSVARVLPLHPWR